MRVCVCVCTFVFVNVCERDFEIAKKRIEAIKSGLKIKSRTADVVVVCRCCCYYCR